jgi:hypothetical protein
LKTNSSGNRYSYKASIEGTHKNTEKAEAEPEARHLPCSPPVHLDPLEVVPSLGEREQGRIKREANVRRKKATKCNNGYQVVNNK